MNRLVSPLAVAALALAACPPNETGALCQDSTVCPSGQSCQSGQCEPSGGAIGMDGGAGSDAGTGLYGTVALNGGAIPSNLAWVYEWDHYPNVSDGGIEAPQATVIAGDGGTFSFEGVDAGGSYYLAAQYDLDGDGNPAQPGDRFGIDPHPASPGPSPITVDVNTAVCSAWSDFDVDVPETLLLALIAEVPDITGAGELANATVIATDPSGTTLALNQRSGSGNPYLDGRYAWTSSGTSAVAGNYRFAVRGKGYPNGSCVVDNEPLTQGPNSLSVPSPLAASSDQTITWVSAPGTEEDDIEVLDASSSPETLQLYQQSVTSPYTLKANSCPTLGKCRIRIFSIHFASTFPAGVGIESASISRRVITTG